MTRISIVGPLMLGAFLLGSLFTTLATGYADDWLRGMVAQEVEDRGPVAALTCDAFTVTQRVDGRISVSFMPRE